MPQDQEQPARTRKEQRLHQERRTAIKRGWINEDDGNEEDEESEEVELEDLKGQVFDSKGRPEFDRDGLSIDYDDL